MGTGQPRTILLVTARSRPAGVLATSGRRRRKGRLSPPPTGTHDMHLTLTDADYGHMLLGDLDLDAQFIAIRNALARNKEVEAASNAEIRAIADAARKAVGQLPGTSAT